MSKVLIRSAGESFRRAGITGTRAGVIVDSDELTDEQKAAIAAEPQLSVSAVEDDDDAGKAAKTAAKEAKTAAKTKASK